MYILKSFVKLKIIVKIFILERPKLGVMQIKFTYAQKTVYKLLAKEKVNLLSISELCRVLNLNRKSFYKRYGNKTNFLTLYLIQNIHNEMKNHSHRNLDDYFYRLLLHLEKDKIFYENMFRLLKKNCVCSDLKEKLFEIIWTKMQYEDKIANVFVQEMTNLIYAHIFIWITHSFYQRPEQVLKEIDTLINRLKHIAENPKFIMKVATETRTYLWGEKEIN